jgi:hypothetical protein
MDYPLQTDFMAKGKNWNTPVPGVPWYYIMTAHCLLHAIVVLMFTGALWCFFVEFAVHFILDCLKCAGRTNIHQDQAGHVGCKILYTLLT